jgi:hypothetical protein
MGEHVFHIERNTFTCQNERPVIADTNMQCFNHVGIALTGFITVFTYYSNIVLYQIFFNRECSMSKPYLVFLQISTILPLTTNKTNESSEKNNIR